MAEIVDIQAFVADPRRLIELCRRVVQHLTAAVDAAATPERQRELQEVQQIMASLEKLGVEPPVVRKKGSCTDSWSTLTSVGHNSEVI